MLCPYDKTTVSSTQPLGGWYHLIWLPLCSLVYPSIIHAALPFGDPYCFDLAALASLQTGLPCSLLRNPWIQCWRCWKCQSTSRIHPHSSLKRVVRAPDTATERIIERNSIRRKLLKFTSDVGNFPFAFTCYMTIGILRFALIDNYPVKGAVSGFLASCVAWSCCYRVSFGPCISLYIANGNSRQTTTS